MCLEGRENNAYKWVAGEAKLKATGLDESYYDLNEKFILKVVNFGVSEPY